MATRVQKRRGSPSDHTSFTSGAVGEVTVEMPTARGSGSSQAYAALYVHHGDGAVGDRIASETEMKDTTRTVVDEQKFLAIVKGFRPIDDDGSTANPDILPSRWEYEWEECSISGGDTDVAKVVTIDLAGSCGDNTDKTIIVPTDIYGKTVSIPLAVTSGQGADVVATNVVSAVTGESTSLYSAAVTGDGTVVTFTADVKSDLLLPVINFPTGITGVTGTSTRGQKYNIVTGGSGDLGRKSDPGGDGTHEFAAINIAEIQNSLKFIGPGIGDGISEISEQSATPGADVINVFPTNFKVVPVGGTTDYATGEPTTTADTGQADRFRNTAVQYVVEMTERRKLNPGTGSGQTVGTANSSGFNCFYYFNVPNTIIGPC